MSTSVQFTDDPWLDGGEPESQPSAAPIDIEIVAAPEPTPKRADEPGPSPSAQPAVHKTDETTLRHPLTEVGNSQRFIDAFGSELRYCHHRKCWYLWNGQCWKRDETLQVVGLMKTVAGSIIAEALSETDDDKRKKIFKWWAQSEKRHVIENAIALARDVVPVTPEEFDADPYKLNVQNGTLDLRTGILQAHTRADMMSKISPVEFRADATCPRWEQFLREIMPDQETREFLQRAVGYSLTGTNAEHCFFLLWGSGRNGKSTFLKTIQHVLGDYARQSDFQSFTESQGGGVQIRNDIARLEGARLVCAVEGKQSGWLAESLVKMLTGGDKIAARMLYQEHREFEAIFKLWLGTNHKPRITGTDIAIWSRVRLIPFTQSFAGKEDRMLGEKLLQEASGILNWALEGLRQYLADGLQAPAQVVAATSEYQQDSDQIGRFLAARTVQNPEVWCHKKALYAAYKRWTLETKEYQFKEHDFSESMVERGYQDHRKNSGMVWLGLDLVPGV
jgi:putative DNA primase/helicase